MIFSSNLFADRLVLVQGYLGSSNDWSDAGISQLLEKNDWPLGGSYNYGSFGVLFRIETKQTTENAYYTVELPTEAGLLSQAYYLRAYLKHLSATFPDEKIILAGHSAGGVLARLVMVKNPGINIKILLTIASPHLGTDSAELGRLVGSTPLSIFAPMIGAGTINRSQDLYQDLLPERPNTFLFWLNRQPHPVAEYYSVVRDINSPNGGDFIVPSYSQYLDKVYALKSGRASSYIVQGSHSLVLADGMLLLDIINEKFLNSI